jgi:hypothetical protein
MGNPQTEHLRVPRLNVAWQPGLPAGARQADCDGRADQLAEASGDRLWKACDATQQESLSARFVQVHAECLRDALLDIHDVPGSSAALPDQAPSALLGRVLWKLWTGYRDRALREMHGRGELPSI